MGSSPFGLVEGRFVAEENRLLLVVSLPCHSHLTRFKDQYRNQDPEDHEYPRRSLGSPAWILPWIPLVLTLWISNWTEIDPSWEEDGKSGERRRKRRIMEERGMTTALHVGMRRLWEERGERDEYVNGGGDGNGMRWDANDKRGWRWQRAHGNWEEGGEKPFVSRLFSFKMFPAWYDIAREHVKWRERWKGMRRIVGMSSKNETFEKRQYNVEYEESPLWRVTKVGIMKVKITPFHTVYSSPLLFTCCHSFPW